jgi:hypothetical protein
MRTSDGRVVTATCKEKSKAREEYEQALSEGKESSLLDWVSDDSQFKLHPGAASSKRQRSLHNFRRIHSCKFDGGN